MGAKYGSGSSGRPIISGLSESVKPRIPLSRRRFISLIVKSMSHTGRIAWGNRRLCDSAWTSTKKSLYIVRMAERSSMSSMAKMWFDANPMPFGYRIWASTPMASSRPRRASTSHADRSITSNGCATCEPRIFSRPVLMVLPPMLAHSSPSRYHAVIPSTVFCTGTRSFRAAGARSSHKEGGSVKWASQSTIPTLSSVSVPTGFVTVVAMMLLIFRAVAGCPGSVRRPPILGESYE